MPRAGQMRQILLSMLKILISAVLLYFALRKVNLSDLASRFNVASFGWIGMAIAATVLQIFIGVLRWCERGVRSAADDWTGNALQLDWNILQPDAALLDWG